MRCFFCLFLIFTLKLLLREWNPLNVIIEFLMRYTWLTASNIISFFVAFYLSFTKMIDLLLKILSQTHICLARWFFHIAVAVAVAVFSPIEIFAFRWLKTSKSKMIFGSIALAYNIDKKQRFQSEYPGLWCVSQSMKFMMLSHRWNYLRLMAMCHKQYERERSFFAFLNCDNDMHWSWKLVKHKNNQLQSRC